MSDEMKVYNEAFRELEESILIALDDAYSDGANMDDAFNEIVDYVNSSGCGNQTSMLTTIYSAWKEDHDFSNKVLVGNFNG